MAAPVRAQVKETIAAVPTTYTSIAASVHAQVKETIAAVPTTYMAASQYTTGASPRSRSRAHCTGPSAGNGFFGTTTVGGAAPQAIGTRAAAPARMTAPQCIQQAPVQAMAAPQYRQQSPVRTTA